MPRFEDDRPEWEDDPEAPDASDCTPDDAEADDATCPSCGAAVYHDAERCPYCGDYITPTFGTARPARRGLWIAVSALAIAAFLASLIWWMR